MIAAFTSSPIANALISYFLSGLFADLGVHVANYLLALI